MSAPETVPDTSSIRSQAPPEERMRALIEVLSSYIEMYHGGRVDLVDFDGETLVVRMSGACEGCRLSATTLHGWVEGTARQFFPSLQTVVAA